MWSLRLDDCTCVVRLEVYPMVGHQFAAESGSGIRWSVVDLIRCEVDRLVEPLLKNARI
jgi:hypothetical protein